MLAATVNSATPLPVPVEPLLIVIHESLLSAVQVQPGAEAVTFIVPLPPVRVKDLLCGSIEKLQFTDIVYLLAPDIPSIVDLA